MTYFTVQFSNSGFIFSRESGYISAHSSFGSPCNRFLESRDGGTGGQGGAHPSRFRQLFNPQNYLHFTQCLKQHLFPSTLIRLSVFSSNYCHCTEQLYLTNLIWYLFNCLISNYFYKLLNVLLKIYTINIFRFCNS